MTRFSLSSLRVRLLLLVLTAVLPALGLVFYTALEQRRSATVEVQETALRLARLASSNQGQLIGGVRQLLVSLSQLPEIRARDAAACSAFLSKLLQQYPLYANLGVASADGTTRCSALPVQTPVNLSDRAYFQRALRTRDFAIGDYQIGRITGKATVNFGYPVIEEGRIEAVVFSALDLAWLNQLAAQAELPSGSTFTVIDQNGTILVQYPHAEKWVGQSLNNASFMRTILDQRTGVAEAASMEGVPSLFGFTPLFGVQGNGDVYVGVGIPKEAAFSEVNRILSRHLFGLGLVSLLALLAAWVGSDLFILRQVDTLTSITQRFAAGDFSARNGPFYRKGELGLLTRTFDKMAESIEKYMVALEHQATHDKLTGLPNVVLLRDRLHQAVLAGQREQKPLALLIIDLDRFKEINNTLGHKNGDLILRQIGTRLKEALRKSDTIARMGGDAFAVLLPMTGAEGSMETAQKIIQRLEEAFSLEGLTLDVEVSIGIALFPDHGEEAELLIQRADVAVSLARQTGNGFAVYASERDPHSMRRLALMGQLRHAIESGQLILYYQPKIDLRSGHIIGMEALVRWMHPEYGFIPPDQFIGPAEQTGLIRPLTLWVVETALRQCRVWHQKGYAFSVSVNVSARNLIDPQLPDQIARLLQTHDISPRRLELEITESAIMADPSKAMEILTRFNQIGISLSIDDFGTGYSSLSYLKRLPVDTIKIDKSFVKNMTEDENDAMIVRSTIDLGHNLGLRVIAEGVESQEIWDKLVALGCDAVQGYHISRPIPAADMERWLAEVAPQKGWTVGAVSG